MTTVGPPLPRREPGAALAEATGEQCPACLAAHRAPAGLIAPGSLGRLAFPVLEIGTGRVQLHGCPYHAGLAAEQISVRLAWLRLYANARDLIVFEGHHPGECDGPPCSGHLIAYMERSRRLADAVTATGAYLQVTGPDGDPGPADDGTDPLRAAAALATEATNRALGGQQ